MLLGLGLGLGRISIGARGAQARGLAPRGALLPQHPPLKKEGKRKEKRKKKERERTEEKR